MTGDTSSSPQGTADDVERIAREVMGWKRGWEIMTDARQPQDWYFEHDGTWWRDSRAGVWWNPFGSADADYRVLERVREVWLPPARRDWLTSDTPDRRWFRFCEELPQRVADYVPGAFARAALAVLREMEDKG